MFSRKKKIPNTDPAMEVEYNALHTARYQMCGVDDTIYNYFDRSTQCLPRPLSILLHGMKGFATIREHTDRISQQGFRGIDSEAINHCIRDLYESGILITKNKALEILRSAEEAGTGGAISTAAWITKDRPDSLVGSMESFIANFKRYGHTVRLFVSDDSTEQEKSDELSARLSAMAKRESITVDYAGLRERRKLRDAILEKASPDHLPAEVLDFALFGIEGISPSHGANRNAVLLANAGEMLLSTDDDVYCDLRVPPEDGCDLELTTRIQPDIREIYPDKDTPVRLHPAVSADILSFHERLLGKRISEILGSIIDNGRIKVDSLDPKYLTLYLRTGGQVKTTVTGAMGDSGMVSPRYLLWLEEEHREKYTASEEIFRSALASKEVYQTSSHYAISGNSFFWSMSIGIDNRDILPPFIPILRGEDTIFSKMLDSVAENAMVGTLPVAIYHRPVNSRTYEKDSALNVRPEITELFIPLLQQFHYPFGCKTSSDRLIALGSYIAGLGSLPLEEFEEFMRQMWLGRAMILTARIETLLQQYSYKPPYWADYLEKFIISMRNFGYTSYISAALDLFKGDARSAAQSCRDIIRRYGELLQWWPVIFETAKDIRRNG